MALSTSQTRRAWSSYLCNRRGWLEISFLGRSPVRIIDICADAWEACEAALKATGYTSADIVGSYNCRRIAGYRSRSLHSYRLALDIDPRKNWKHMPFGRTKITRRNVAAVEAIRTRNGKRVFTCGTRFKDPMHIQIACAPADIKTGINWATVKGHDSHEDRPGSPRRGSAVSRPTLRLNSHGDAVRDAQRALNAKNPRRTIKVDGRYGPRTRDAVRDFQRRHHLGVDGICGPNTWAELDAV